MNTVGVCVRVTGIINCPTKYSFAVWDNIRDIVMIINDLYIYNTYKTFPRFYKAFFIHTNMHMVLVICMDFIYSINHFYLSIVVYKEILASGGAGDETI